jgi:hypothetical protein
MPNTKNKKDATVTSINAAKDKGFQIPQKTPQQLEDEQKIAEFMKGNPSRQEVQEFADQLVSLRMNEAINMFNMIIAILERALVGNGVLTEQQLKEAKDSIEAEAEAIKNAKKIEKDSKETENVQKHENEVSESSKTPTK